MTPLPSAARAALVATMLAVAATAAAAQTIKPHRIAKDHPIVGRWTYTLPDGSGTETYHFRSDGTSVVTSNEEIAESVFDIAAKPDANGFYKWADELVKDNGKKDCAGEVTAVGKVVTNFILFSPGGDQFVICAQRSLDACFGPLERAQGTSI
jgi:hypothetical protein